MESSNITIDTFPDIKKTLLREFNTYDLFLQYLVEQNIPRKYNEFTNSVLDKYIEDDIYALALLFDTHSKEINIDRQQLVTDIFFSLFEDYVNYIKEHIKN